MWSAFVVSWRLFGDERGQVGSELMYSRTSSCFSPFSVSASGSGGSSK
jgi:hypothetical protein